MKKLVIAGLVTLCFLLLITGCQPAGKGIAGIAKPALLNDFYNFPGSTFEITDDGEILVKYYVSPTYSQNNPNYLDDIAEFSVMVEEEACKYIAAEGLGSCAGSTKEEITLRLMTATASSGVSAQTAVTTAAVAGQSEGMIDHIEFSDTPDIAVNTGEVLVAVCTTDSQEDTYLAINNCNFDAILMDGNIYPVTGQPIKYYTLSTTGITGDALYACATPLTYFYDLYAAKTCLPGDLNLGLIGYGYPSEEPGITILVLYYNTAMKDNAIVEPGELDDTYTQVDDNNFVNIKPITPITQCPDAATAECAPPMSWHDQANNLWCDSNCQIKTVQITGGGGSPPPEEGGDDGGGAGDGGSGGSGGGGSGDGPGGGWGGGANPPGGVSPPPGGKPGCGDTIVSGNEQCDPPDFVTCDPFCNWMSIIPIELIYPLNVFYTIPEGLPALPSCGNGIIEPSLGEECDDGNMINGDGCSYDTCFIETIPLFLCHAETDDYYFPATWPQIDLDTETCSITSPDGAEITGILKGNLGQAFMSNYYETTKFAVCYTDNSLAQIYVNKEDCGTDSLIFEFYASNIETYTSARMVDYPIKLTDITQGVTSYTTMLSSEMFSVISQDTTTNLINEYYLMHSIDSTSTGSCTKVGNTVSGTSKLNNAFTKTDSCISATKLKKWICEPESIINHNFQIIDCAGKCVNNECAAVVEIPGDGVIAPGPDFFIDPVIVPINDFDSGIALLTSQDTGIMATLGFSGSVDPYTGYAGFLDGVFAIIGGTAADVTSMMDLLVEYMPSLVGADVYGSFGTYWTAFTHDEINYKGKLEIEPGTHYVGFPFNVGDINSFFRRLADVHLYSYDPAISRDESLRWHVWHSDPALPSDITQVPYAFAIKTPKKITKDFSGTVKTMQLKPGWNLGAGNPLKTSTQMLPAIPGLFFRNKATGEFNKIDPAATTYLPPGTTVWADTRLTSQVARSSVSATHASVTQQALNLGTSSKANTGVGANLGTGIVVAPITGGVTTSTIATAQQLSQHYVTLYLCEYTITGAVAPFQNQKIYATSTSSSCTLPAHTLDGYATQPPDSPGGAPPPTLYPLTIIATTNLGAILNIFQPPQVYQNYMKAVFYCPTDTNVQTGARINWMKLEIGNHYDTQPCTWGNRTPIAGPIGWVYDIQQYTSDPMMGKLLGMRDGVGNVITITDPAQGMPLPAGIIGNPTPDFFQNYNPVGQKHELGWGERICLGGTNLLNLPESVLTLTDLGAQVEAMPDCQSPTMSENVFCDLSTQNNWNQGPNLFCPQGTNCQGGLCLSASCGDGIVDTPQEECDDSNILNNDGCSDICKHEYCGDGTVQTNFQVRGAPPQLISVANLTEQCELPGIGMCDANCQIITVPPTGPNPPPLNFEQYFGSIANASVGDPVLALLGPSNFSTAADANLMYGMSNIFLVGGGNPGQLINFFVRGQHVIDNPFTPLAVTRLDLGVTPTNVTPPGPGPLPAHCNNSMLDPGETGIDCGGVCLPCPNGQNCTINADCMSNICHNGVCTSLQVICNNGIFDSQFETATDCGGLCTAKCARGQNCSTNSDCVTNRCVAGICRRPYTPPSGGGGGGGGSATDWYRPSFGGGGGAVGFALNCTDDWICNEYGPCMPPGIKTRTCFFNDYPNCTGALPKPEEEMPCVLPPPPAASCHDIIQNQDETFTDCGGVICVQCDPGLSCLVHSDCITGYCDPMTQLCGWPPVIEAPAPPPEKSYWWVWLVSSGGVIAAGAGVGAYLLLLRKPPIGPRLTPLKKYVDTFTKKGVSKEKIGKKLKDSGWKKEDIKKVMK